MIGSPLILPRCAPLVHSALSCLHFCSLLDWPSVSARNADSAIFFISLILYYYFFRFTHANVYCTQPPSTGQTCFGMLVSEGMKESSSSLSSVRSHAFYAVAQNVFPKEFRHFFLSVFRFFSFLDSFFISFDLNIHNLYPHHGQNGFELLAAIVCMKCVCVR